MVEQDCVYQDIDGNDPKSIHVLGSIEGDLAAYARILDQGLSYADYSSIGRIVVSPVHRAQKLGHALVDFAIKTTQKEYANSLVKQGLRKYARACFRKNQ